MNWEAINWQTLDRLRGAFLDGSAGRADYWQSEADLTCYDATFAQRIGWKWDYVLAELQRRRWTPAPGTLLDWGGGSGIAHRAFLDHFGTGNVADLHIWDRSPLAMRFAARRAQEKYPGLKTLAGNGAPDATLPPNTTLLISHVLTELQPEQVEKLADVAATATSVIWVEPGTYEASLTLIAIRERLRNQFNVVAPCTHQARCGILEPQNDRHWCHHFATPPTHIFMDAGWAKFGELAGVDLRSLPLSFLVLDRRPAPEPPPDTVRVIGRPRLYKPYALLLGCDATGVADKRLSKRHHAEAFRQLKRGNCDPLQVWQCDGEEITEARPM